MERVTDDRVIGRSRRTSGIAGFTLVGVVVAIAILTILIAAVGPSISTIIQRDKETELIFRGKQYARAIVVFQKRFGRFPNELKELSNVKPRSIRQLFNEPDVQLRRLAGDHRRLGRGGPDGPGRTGPARRRASRPAAAPDDPGSGIRQSAAVDLHRAPADAAAVPRRRRRRRRAAAPTPAPFSTGIFGNRDNKTVGPIVGVRSKVHHKALKKWRDLECYDEWRFIAGDADNDDKSWFDPNSLRGPNFTPPPPKP